MNFISNEKAEWAFSMFIGGASIREVAKAVGIAKETAHRLQWEAFIGMIDNGDNEIKVKVNRQARRVILAKDIPLKWISWVWGREVSQAEWVEYLGSSG